MGAALLAGLFLGSIAAAATLDDFRGPGIDPARWGQEGTGFTSSGDGRLRFAGTGAQGSRLLSRARYTRGVFTLAFRDYRCDNRAPSGQHLGSLAGFGLGVGPQVPWVRMERGQVAGRGGRGGRRDGGYLEVNWTTADAPGRIRVNWMPCDWTSGFLQLRWDGKRVSFHYRASAAGPWTPMLARDPDGQPLLGPGRQPTPLVLEVQAPGEGVPLFIQGLPGGKGPEGYSLGFTVDGIDLEPAMPPA